MTACASPECLMQAFGEHRGPMFQFVRQLPAILSASDDVTRAELSTVRRTASIYFMMCDCITDDHGGRVEQRPPNHWRVPRLFGKRDNGRRLRSYHVQHELSSHQGPVARNASIILTPLDSVPGIARPIVRGTFLRKPYWKTYRLS